MNCDLGDHDGEDGDDADHDEQFRERECSASTSRFSRLRGDLCLRLVRALGRVGIRVNREGAKDAKGENATARSGGNARAGHVVGRGR